MVQAHIASEVDRRPLARIAIAWTNSSSDPTHKLSDIHMHPGFHILLPPREIFTPAASGAVALGVRDFCLASRNRKLIKIYGGPQTRAHPDVEYVTISPSWLGFTGWTEDYARQSAKLIPDTPQTYIEVHNRAAVFRIIRKRHKHSRMALYLRNDPDTMGGLATQQERMAILRQSDAIFCLSDFVRTRFLAGIDSAEQAKVHVINNALTMSAYEAPSAPPVPRILYVGRMVPEKGVHQLAQALASVLPRYPNWLAGFIGANRHGGSTVSAFEKEVQSILTPLGNQVLWFGQLSNVQAQAHMHASSIVVMPTICTEAFGRVAMEAMANGCAVISSGRGGLQEATGPAALNINPEDPAEIAEALESLMSSPERLASARQAGWEYARQNFNITDVASRLDDFRERLMESNK